jgi:hypothetical protein
MVFIYKDKWTGFKGNPERCRASVPDGGTSVGFHQCLRKPIVFRVNEDDGESYGWCRLHDPLTVEERRKLRRINLETQWAAERKAIEREQRERRALYACKKALERIVRGHKITRASASNILGMFPDD